MITYYTQEQFEVVVAEKLEQACKKMNCTYDQNAMVISLNNGEMRYAIKGELVLKTKRDAKGFYIAYPEEKININP